jgi:hypothetical protein
MTLRDSVIGRGHSTRVHSAKLLHALPDVSIAANIRPTTCITIAANATAAAPVQIAARPLAECRRAAILRDSLIAAAVRRCAMTTAAAILNCEQPPPAPPPRSVNTASPATTAAAAPLSFQPPPPSSDAIRSRPASSYFHDATDPFRFWLRACQTA